MPQHLMDTYLTLWAVDAARSKVEWLVHKPHECGVAQAISISAFISNTWTATAHQKIGEAGMKRSTSAA